MPGPVKKFYGNISIDALTELKHLIETHEKYGKQLKVGAAQWDDGGISIDVWDKEAKKATKLGSLRVSQFENNGGGFAAPAAAAPSEPDLPF